MYELIARNKRNSVILVIMMFFVLGLVGGTIGAAIGEKPEAGIPGVIVSFIIAVILFLTSWYGGKNILMSLSGAKKIVHADHPRLFNVVEEMSIAAGIPMPEIYIIQDSAPNAFATGRSPEKAAVAITTGLLDKLDRDELQGVIAHEISHIRNYDIRFAMLMSVMVGTIALLCDAFLRGMFRSSRGTARRRGSPSKGGGAGILILIILAIILAILAPFVAKIIELAMSRQREYLADVSAVELTRYPEGLARALEILGKDEDVLEAANRATQHLYIVNPIKPFEARASSLFSTHPPIEERIKRLRSIAAEGAEKTATPND